MIHIHLHTLVASLLPSVDEINTKGLGAVKDLIKIAVDLALGIAGSLSVIFIIVAGLKYVLSAGNPSAVKSAKDTLMYAIIGLIITISAVAIVNFATDLYK